jgi:hypothetical protein
MKNIHILPTDKPSRLFISNTDKVLELDTECIISEDWWIKNQNIYITSDEEIKEGDWFTDDNNSLKRSYKLSHVQFANPKKIILTTDQSLDGVQAIDDEFLEWFVKNPSCEEVEVEKIQYNPVFDEDDLSYDGMTEYYTYKIIIPKEELKQEQPKTFKELFANTGIEPTTDKNGNIQYNFKATMKKGIDFGKELSKWGYNKGNSIDVEILVNEILPDLFKQFNK